MHRHLVGCALLVASFACLAESAWTYRKADDAMTGKEGQWATLESVNSLDLAFPYQGMNMGELMVRKHPKFGQDVIFQIGKGQLICGVYRCTVSVRFDSAQPVTFTAVPPSDHSTTALFLEPASKFIAMARKAHDIRVQATVYENGNPILQFHTAQPLTWPPK